MLQWSPVLETGNTEALVMSAASDNGLQWSPVLETGNTLDAVFTGRDPYEAAMEPGLRDREYPSS